MPLVITSNITSLMAQRHLANSTRSLGKTSEALASGERINRAGDDAAGLQLSEKLRTQIRGSKKALDNVQDAINFLRVADGALQQMHDHIQRVRELIIQAQNDTYSSAQRTVIQNEIRQIFHEIDRIASSTNYNGIYMFSDMAPNNFVNNFPPPMGFRVQLGPNNELPFTPINRYVNTINLNRNNELGDMDMNNLGLVTWNDNTGVYTIPFATRLERNYLMSRIDSTGDGVSNSAMEVINAHRAGIGALMNRLENAATNLQINIENLSASESRIRNLDVAEASAKLTRNQILQQSANTMLMQANQSPALALELLKPPK